MGVQPGALRHNSKTAPGCAVAASRCVGAPTLPSSGGRTAWALCVEIPTLGVSDTTRLGICRLDVVKVGESPEGKSPRAPPAGERGREVNQRSKCAKNLRQKPCATTHGSGISSAC